MPSNLLILSSLSPPAFYLSQCPPHAHLTDHRFPFGSHGKESACNLGDVGWEDALQEGMETHPSILAWRIPMDKGAWREQASGPEDDANHLSFCI